MKIAVIGTGYVGLVSAACFAELGHEVYGVDIDEEKIKKCKRGESPIYEPGLEEILKEGLRNGRLSFTTDLTGVLSDVKIVFSAVATPPGEGYKADLRAVFTVAETVARHADHDLVFVNKSTVPVGTGKQCEEKISDVLKERGVNYQIPVVSNPEFLREGMAVSDTIMPDRVVVGINHNEWARELMEDLYRPITRVGKPLVFMSRESSEIVKYASNSLLATKISFINMLTELTEKTGANIRDVARGVGLDTRIGPRFLHAGIGYGGSCFPKDVKALLATASDLGIPMDIVEATDRINSRQRKRFFKQITDLLPANANIGVLGLSFKPKTDDMREAPSLDLIPELVEKGHNVKVFDPAAMEVAKPLLLQGGTAPSRLQGSLTFCSTTYEAVKDADTLVVLTEWDEFRGIDLDRIKNEMRGDDLFDGRNIYEPDEVREAGLEYHGIGIG